MRNLKKFLALVLAMMMTLSLMVTVNAASNFTDSDEINDKFDKAVEVLNGMGVFKGYANGDKFDFQPSKNITRAEVAAIVYRLATGDAEGKQAHLYASGAAKFGDVVSDHWALGEIGYCANNLLVLGYDDTHFGPGDDVTGVQALAMILRAVGYGKNDEFRGWGWDTNVYGVARGEGLLVNVDNTNYTGRLSQPATRELVAELLFQAAQIPTVNYQYGTYNKYTTTVTVAGVPREYNPSLGERYYGLTCHTGIILGNQATGEKTTKVGFETNAADATVDPGEINDNGSYIYADNAAGDGAEGNVTLAFDYKTGLGDFGHKVEVWYRGNSAATKQTYAMFDESANVALVDGVTDLALTKAADSDHPEYIATAAKANDFKVTTSTTVYWNYAFAPMAAGNKGADGTDPAGDTSIGDHTSTIGTTNQAKANTHPLYVLISNSDDNTLDMVISLDLTVTKITQANDTKAPYTVGVVAGNGVADLGSTAANHYFGIAADADAVATKDFINLAADNIVGDSTKELGKHVVAIEITGTTDTNDGVTTGNATAVTGGPTSTYYYQLSELTRVEKYTVVARDADETVTLADGSKLERSPLALATDGTFQDASHVAAPTAYGEYNFTLDADGKYIFWEPIPAGSTFVYGTYLDYTSDLSTSLYRYPLIGVGLDGKMFQRDVTAYSLFATPTTHVEFNDLSNTDTYDKVPLPKKDANSAIGLPKAGVYVGYMIDEDGVLTYVKAGVNDGNAAVTDKKTDVKQATAADFGSAPIVINANDANVKMGVKEVVANGDLYLTNETQFYLVSGAGTANQKITPYKGLADLMKGNSSVTIDVSKAYAAEGYLSETLSKTGDDVAGSGSTLDNGARSYNTVYYTTSQFDYAQDYTQSSKQVDMVFIPEAYVDMTTSDTSGLIFVGESDADGLVNSGATAAVQYTVYVNGEEQKIWIKGTSVTADGSIDDATNSVEIIQEVGDNVFYNLKDTGKKAADGQAIYDVVGFTSAPGVIGLYYDGTATAAEARFGTTGEAPQFRATNYSRQLAFIDSVTNLGDGSANLYNVGGAKVKNLDTDAYPGVEDVATLSKAASLTDDEAVAVSCVLNADDAKVVDFIYVNAP